MKKILFPLVLMVLPITLNANNQWHQKASFPGEGRHRASSWSIGNRGYIGLGHYNTSIVANKSDVWEYNPADDSWMQKSDYGGGATYGATAFVIGDKAYVGAHFLNNNEFYEFCPVNNTWTQITSCPVSQTDFPSFALNGKGYVLGSSTMYCYDPNVNDWFICTAPPGIVQSTDATLVINEKGYLRSGNSFWEYKPNTDSWAPRSLFPGDWSIRTSQFTVNKMGYVVCGYNLVNAQTTKEVWVYDSEWDTWTQLDDFPGAARRYSVAFSIGNKGYLGTGTNGINLNDFWEYDPTLNLDSEEYSFDIYPNPVKDILMIKTNGLFEHKIIEFELYNCMGQKVMSKRIDHENNAIDIGSLPSGDYFIYMSCDEQLIKTEKILIR